MINGFEDERTFDGEIGVDAWRARPRGWFRVTPRRDRVFVKPHGEAATINQSAIVLRPIANPVTEDLRSSCHAFILATEIKWGNVQQRRTMGKIPTPLAGWGNWELTRRFGDDRSPSLSPPVNQL